MRSVLSGKAFDWHQLAIAFGLNVIYLILAGLLFARTLASAREKGLLVKFSAS